MKRLILAVLFSLTFIGSSIVEGRQYDIDHLMDLIDSGSEQAIQEFFKKPRYVKKIKHLIEFSELFREKLQESYGYKPSWKEAYVSFKANLSNLNYPKEQKKQLLKIFKEVSILSQKADEKGIKLKKEVEDTTSSRSFNVNEDLPDELAIAYSEALGAGLLLIIPSGASQVVAGCLLSDSINRTYNYVLGKRKDSSHHYERDSHSANEMRSEPNCDRDSWDKEY
ncbi:MAG: hypothetical protein H7A41_01705 [Chlamydiales bacterium]|nr:hypothetical protein [Chlamydiales bacterium]